MFLVHAQLAKKSKRPSFYGEYMIGESPFDVNSVLIGANVITLE